MKPIKIATRNSPLALWQAEHVKQKLMQIHTNLKVDLFGMTTTGDQLLDKPLATAGGKGLFIKELEQALLNGEADIAVHSMKDVTIDLPHGLTIPVIMRREDPRDVLISNQYKCIEQLPTGGILGTSSLRRQSQVLALRPDLQLRGLCGNVGTRLRKLDEGQYDAIMLAAAGIKRLGLAARIAQLIPHSQLLPAIGQGAIGIECRANDPTVHGLIHPLNNQNTALCVHTERAFSRHLFGGCQLPIAAKAVIAGNEITLTGLVADIEGRYIIKAEQKGRSTDFNEIGIALAEKLIARGADKILKALRH